MCRLRALTALTQKTPLSPLGCLWLSLSLRARVVSRTLLSSSIAEPFPRTTVTLPGYAMSFHCIGPGHPPISANAFKQVASSRWIVTLECQEAINEVRCDHPAHCAPVPPTARRRRASRSSLSSPSPWSRALRSAATSRRRLLRSRRGTTSGQSPRRRRR